MLIFLVIAIIFGLIKKQPRKYWINASFAVGLAFVLGLLLAGGGTLENPKGDGIITHFVRSSTDDGPLMGVWAIFVICITWGLPLYIIKRGYVKKEAV